MRWLRKVRFKFLKKQRGVSLIEVLVVVAILGLIGTVVIRALDTNYRADRTLDEQVTGMNLATDYTETIKKLPYAVSYSSAGDNITIPLQYSVDIKVEASSDGNNFVPANGSDNETFQKIWVYVSREGKPVLYLCSYRTKR